MESATINAARLMQQVTLNVRVDTRELRVRLWLGKMLLRLAAGVLNCTVQVSVNE